MLDVKCTVTWSFSTCFCALLAVFHIKWFINWLIDWLIDLLSWVKWLNLLCSFTYSWLCSFCLKIWNVKMLFQLHAALINIIIDSCFVIFLYALRWSVILKEHTLADKVLYRAGGIESRSLLTLLCPAGLNGLNYVAPDVLFSVHCSAQCHRRSYWSVAPIYTYTYTYLEQTRIFWQMLIDI